MPPDAANGANILSQIGHFLFGVPGKFMRLACTRFRRHRVRCFYGTGGESWRDEGLRGSSSLRLCG